MKWFGRGAPGEANYTTRDAGKEVKRKTTKKMERCDPKRSREEWTEPRGSCSGGSGPLEKDRGGLMRQHREQL